MLKAEYQSRGPVPQDVIEAVPFEQPALKDGGVLLEMPTALIFRDITLRGFWLAQWFRTATPDQQQALYGKVVLVGDSLGG